MKNNNDYATLYNSNHYNKNIRYSDFRSMLSAQSKYYFTRIC